MKVTLVPFLLAPDTLKLVETLAVILVFYQVFNTEDQGCLVAYFYESMKLGKKSLGVRLRLYFHCPLAVWAVPRHYWCHRTSQISPCENADFLLFVQTSSLTPIFRSYPCGSRQEIMISR
jgi:hypothetical protein